MTITELMVGDWVKMFNSRSEYITDTQVTAVMLYMLEQDQSVMRLEPIQLTPEIFKKNGFKGEGYLFLDLDESSYLEYYPFEGRLRKIIQLMLHSK